MPEKCPKCGGQGVYYQRGYIVSVERLREQLAAAIKRAERAEWKLSQTRNQRAAANERIKTLEGSLVHVYGLLRECLPRSAAGQLWGRLSALLTDIEKET